MLNTPAIQVIKKEITIIMTKTAFIKHVMVRLGLSTYDSQPRYYYMFRTLEIASEKPFSFQRYNFSKKVLSIVAEEFGITTQRIYGNLDDLMGFARKRGSIIFFYEFLEIPKHERIPRISCFEFIQMLAIYIAKHTGTLSHSYKLYDESRKRELIFSYLGVDLSSKGYLYLNTIIDIMPKGLTIYKRGLLRSLYVELSKRYDTNPGAVAHVIERSIIRIFSNEKHSGLLREIMNVSDNEELNTPTPSIFIVKFVEYIRE